MSLKERIAALRAAVTPASSTRAKVLPPQQQPLQQQQQVMAQQPYYAQQQPAPQAIAPQGQPQAPKTFGSSIRWDSNESFQKHWADRSFIGDVDSMSQVVGALLSGDVTAMPANYRGKQPATILLDVINTVARNAAVHASELAMFQVSKGITADLPVLEATMGQQFNNLTAEQLLTQDNRITGNPQLLQMAKFYMEEARKADPSASATDIKDFIDLTLANLGIPAFKDGAGSIGKNGQNTQAKEVMTPAQRQEREFEMVFGNDTKDNRDVPPPTNTATSQSTGQSAADVAALFGMSGTGGVSAAPSGGGIM